MSTIRRAGTNHYARINGICIGPVVILGFGLYGFLADLISTRFVSGYWNCFCSLGQYQL
jgi:hypothetical protein